MIYKVREFVSKNKVDVIVASLTSILTIIIELFLPKLFAALGLELALNLLAENRIWAVGVFTSLLVLLFTYKETYRALGKYWKLIIRVVFSIFVTLVVLSWLPKLAKIPEKMEDRSNWVKIERFCDSFLTKHDLTVSKNSLEHCKIWIPVSPAAKIYKPEGSSVLQTASFDLSELPTSPNNDEWPVPDHSYVLTSNDEFAYYYAPSSAYPGHCMKKLPEGFQRYDNGNEDMGFRVIRTGFSKNVLGMDAHGSPSCTETHWLQIVPVYTNRN